MPGPRFGFVKLLALSGSHCTKCADEQHRPAGFESRLVPDLPLLFIPTLIGLRAFDRGSSRVWWEAATNKQTEDCLLTFSFSTLTFDIQGFTFLLFWQEVIIWELSVSTWSLPDLRVCWSLSELPDSPNLSCLTDWQWLTVLSVGTRVYIIS